MSSGRKANASSESARTRVLDFLSFRRRDPANGNNYRHTTGAFQQTTINVACIGSESINFDNEGITQWKCCTKGLHVWNRRGAAEQPLALEGRIPRRSLAKTAGMKMGARGVFCLTNSNRSIRTLVH